MVLGRLGIGVLTVLGIDRPLPVRYVTWLGDIATGNFGYSPFRRRDVADLIVAWEKHRHSGGAATGSILVTQLLPNIFNPIFVYSAGLVGLSMIVASSLSFLGLGWP